MKTPKRKRFQSNSHARSPKQESEIADRVGGRVTRGSGSGNEKGDVRVEKVVRIEAKTTKNKSFSVTQEIVNKIEGAALPNGEVPAIVVEFIDDQGRRLHELAVVPTYVLDALTDGFN